ncbi:Clp amino terminal domain-containing protein, pathogenicity island component [Geodermatophilus amargosae]|uniref:Clp amino terminal domain-containing protein, pathogenicity island component n=1 Tax=Geodermatophilus amargosae TaxID=1296565 RepID=A0A1I6Y2L8_9ACTN|nr:Clp protease N-terminal domain-containing protein [Geodermatophilus amargosae]SFT44686.1 Clp amino terminal domain-containing protein, pathogenicity island component [Geodermatophilus amargosae]
MGIVTAVRDLRTVRALLTGAEAEARSSGERTPGPEHLLLAATALPDGTASAALARVGVDRDRLRAAVEAAHAAALASVGVGADPGEPALRGPATGPMRSTPQAQQVFREAVAAAKAARSPLRGAHVVAAVCDLERGTAARALSALGVDREQLRDAAHDVS